jgi:pyruvate/2-oxoglutarate dehydrogenase complex dihydrolipoamide acyltransferase (E2) component
MGRPDGTLAKVGDSNYFLFPHVLKKRYDAQNMITVDIPVEPMKQYINEKRKEGISISYLGLVMAAYTRAAAKFPLLNRFVVNEKIYDRNYFSASMVVLRPGAGTDVFSKVYFDPQNDTVFDIQNKIVDYVTESREADSETGLDKLVNAIVKTNFLAKFLVNLILWLDKHGMLPRSLIDALPFHTSFLITNLASIRTNHIYHHLYDFGTSSIFLAMGIPHYIPVKKGKEIENIKTMPIGVVMDERIANGSYFARAFRRMAQLLKDPVLLETAPNPEDIKYDPAIPEKKLYKFK